jgi:hypothetical protein
MSEKPSISAENTTNLAGLREFIANGGDLKKDMEARKNAISLLNHYFGNQAMPIRLKIGMGGDLKAFGTKTEVGEILRMLGCVAEAVIADSAFDNGNNLADKERLKALEATGEAIKAIPRGDSKPSMDEVLAQLRKEGGEV